MSEREPIIEVADVGEFWVPESHKARLIVGVKVRVRLGECPLVGRWGDISWAHAYCHGSERNGTVGRISLIDFTNGIEGADAPGHTYVVDLPDGWTGHYAAAELEPVEE